MDVKHLGPYKDGTYACGGKSIKLDLIPLRELTLGLNTEKVVFGKVVSWIQDSDCVPL